MNFSTTQRRNIVVVALIILIAALSFNALREPAPKAKKEATDVTSEANSVEKPRLKNFDPNTASLKEFVEMGVDKELAVSIIRYRSAGKIFHIKEDLALCYGMSDSTYYALEPYIKIAKKYQYKKREFAKSDRAASEPQTRYEKESVKLPIDINKADSAKLREVSGIGEKTAQAIVQYRELLGGFHSTRQISEINIITESNYEKILTQISANSEDISKIDVNFTAAKELIKHPYISQAMARRWISKLQLKGGYRDIEEMIEDDIFNREEATKLQPYLLF